MLKYPDIVIAFFQKKKTTKITKAISKIRVVEVTSFDIYLFTNLFIWNNKSLIQNWNSIEVTEDKL